MENSTLKFTNCYTYIIIIVLLFCFVKYIALVRLFQKITIKIYKLYDTPIQFMIYALKIT